MGLNLNKPNLHYKKAVGLKINKPNLYHKKALGLNQNKPNLVFRLLTDFVCLYNYEF